MGSRATSAGILLYRRGGDGIEVLLAHPGGPYWSKRDAGAWTVPKGEPEDCEELRDCALRELAEELGPGAPRLTPEELIELGSIRQRGGKVVHAWGGEGAFDPAALDSAAFRIEWPPRSGAEREFPEVDRVLWLGPEAARGKLNPAQVPFVDRLLDRIGGT